MYLVSRFSGLIAIQKDKSGPFKFKLFSWAPLFTLIRLIVFSFPFVVLPYIIYAGGFKEEELNTFVHSLGINTTAGNFMKPNKDKTRNIICYISYFSNYTLYMLPFLFAQFMTAPLNKMTGIAKAEENASNKKHPCFNLGFMFFVLGTVLEAVAALVDTERKLLFF